MDAWTGTTLLYLVGIAFLIAEIFIPSYGVLTIASLAVLGLAVYNTFQISEEAGYVALLALVAILPTSAYLAVKFWHRTPVGKRISPPNPVLTKEDTGVHLDDLRPLVGCRGTAISPLHPVGTCEFDGRRVECVAEVGMIESGIRVEAVGFRGRSLTVKSVDEEAAV